MNMDPPAYNTLILSDLHLGAETSHAGEATRVLKQNQFRRLILLGDIFADLNFARLTKEHWKFLGYIRKLSNPKRNVEVIWVKGKPIARLIDRLNTRWLRMSLKVASGALSHARQRGADRIFCGHTHEAVHIERDGIHYYNAGGWVDSRLTYLTINEQGVSIHEYRERVDDSDSSQERGEADSAFADFADDAGLLEDVEYEGVGR